MWLSRDPIAEAGGINRTAFCNGNPNDYEDRYGLAAYFFGGTGNNLDEGYWSNVELLYFSWDQAAHGNRYYVPGVFSGKTPDNRDYKMWPKRRPTEGARGRTLGARADQMIKYLDAELSGAKPDNEINVFGFSRGSTTALVFLNKIQERQTDSRYSALYKDVKINFVALWDTVKTTTHNYPTDLPKGMKFEHKPLHLIALDEQRLEFFDDEVLDLGAGALQIGYRGVHADVGGFQYKNHNNAFGQITRNDVVNAAWLAGINFNTKQLSTYDVPLNYSSAPTENRGLLYHDDRPRTFPANMYLSPSVRKFGRYTKPYNKVSNSRRMIMTRDWYKWAGRQY